MKKPWASAPVMCANALAMAFSSTALLRAAARRNSVLSFAKASSMGDRSGEYAGKAPHFTAACLTQHAHLGVLVRAQVVKYHHLARPQRGHQNLPDVHLTCRCVGGSIEYHGRAHTCRTHCCNQRGIWRRIARCGAMCSRSTGRTGITRGQIEGATRLVHNHEHLGGPVRDAVTKELALCLITLACPYRLFLRVHPARRMARPRVHWLKLVPCVAFHNAACCTNVASGWAASWACNAGY